MRDALERADDDLWGALLPGDADEATARARYESAVKRATAPGLQYRTSQEIAALPIEEIVRRVQAAMNLSLPRAAVEAVLGKHERPAEEDPAAATFKEAFDLYM